MTDESTLLTQQEIGTLADGTICGNASESPLPPWKLLRQLTVKESVLAFARAIESAVTAKLAKHHAREIVLAKREGWDKRCIHTPHHSINSYEVRNTLFPLPTTTKTRTVTLSDGRVVQYGPTFGTFITNTQSGSARLPWCSGTSNAVSVATASDARLIAGLIEHPTEEITDE